MRYLYFILSFSLVYITGCKLSVTEHSTDAERLPDIYPDYRGITIPCNIAPLNFDIEEPGEQYVTVVYGASSASLAYKGKKVRFGMKEWRQLLKENTGDDLCIDIYVRKGEEWTKYETIRNRIVDDPVDEYLSYRLIEPGYAQYEYMSLNQRTLTNFEEKEIFNNRFAAVSERLSCINCHAYQNHRADRMQFHVRHEQGGTVFIDSDEVYRVNMKTPETLSAAVYPAWHPTENLIAYSVNSTYQTFHLRDPQKIEVQDRESGIILYDVEKNIIYPVVNEPDALETFPAWSAEGDRLFYTSASYNKDGKDKKALVDEMMDRYDSIYYDLMQIPFDKQTLTFGEPEVVACMSDQYKSISFPRVSPEGRSLLFTVSDFGNFSIWHTSSDLYMLDLESGEIRCMEEWNSPRAESYHSWSSTGRWVVFSSRRDDGSYTRPYFAWYGENGETGKPFLLPQKDPGQHLRLFKSYNIPEFTVNAVPVNLRHIAGKMKRDVRQAIYRKRPESL